MEPSLPYAPTFTPTSRVIKDSHWISFSGIHTLQLNSEHVERQDIWHQADQHHAWPVAVNFRRGTQNKDLEECPSPFRSLPERLHLHPRLHLQLHLDHLHPP